jgi:hypothetical protein
MYSSEKREAGSGSVSDVDVIPNPPQLIAEFSLLPPFNPVMHQQRSSLKTKETTENY